MIDALLLLSAALVIGASAGFTARYQRKHRGEERFHFGSWIAFALNFVIVVSVARATNPLIKSGALSDWLLVVAALAGVATMFLVAFMPLKRSKPSAPKIQ